MENLHNQIISELMKIQAENNNCELLQFRSLITAQQYIYLYQILAKYVNTGKIVLDWGSGNGHFSYFLLKSGYKTSGFSFQDFYLRQYFNGFDYEFKQGNEIKPSVIPYPDNKFDAVVSVGVLEHVRETGGNEISSLQEIYRILKPGGYFICYHFPNQFSWIEAIASLFPAKHHHTYRYTTKLIKIFCQQTNFEFLEIKRYGILPRNIWGNLPIFLRNSPLIAKFFNLSDEILKYPFSWICQNYYFVARKKL